MYLGADFLRNLNTVLAIGRLAFAVETRLGTMAYQMKCFEARNLQGAEMNANAWLLKTKPVVHSHQVSLGIKTWSDGLEGSQYVISILYHAQEQLS